eukprot:31350-Pelagococcus_subviridis.AAC.2
MAKETGRRPTPRRVQRRRPVARFQDAHRAVIFQRRMLVHRERVPLERPDPRQAQVHVPAAAEVRQKSPGVLEDDLHRFRSETYHRHCRAVPHLEKVPHRPVGDIQSHRGAHHPQHVRRGRVQHDAHAPDDREVVHRLPVFERDGATRSVKHHRITDERRDEERDHAGDAGLRVDEKSRVAAGRPPREVPERVPNHLHAHDRAREHVQVVHVAEREDFFEMRSVHGAAQVMTLADEEQQVHRVVKVR